MDKEVRREQLSIKPPVTQSDPRIESPEIKVVYQDTSVSEQSLGKSVVVEPENVDSIKDENKQEAEKMDLKEAIKQNLMLVIGSGILIFILGYLVAKK